MMVAATLGCQEEWIQILQLHDEIRVAQTTHSSKERRSMVDPRAEQK